MSKISSDDLLQNLPEFLRRIGEGETFTITDDGEAVAELGPVRQTPLERLEGRSGAEGDGVVGIAAGAAREAAGRCHFSRHHR